MTPFIRTAIIGGIALGAWVLWTGANTIYLAPRSELDAKIAERRTQIAGFEANATKAVQVRRDMSAIIERTLGSDAESVDHHLRARLNRIVEEIDIQSPIIGTGAPRGKETPAQRAMPRRGVWKELRDELDFIEVEANVTGEATLPQVVALVDRIEAEPWIKMITRVDIDPVSDGARFRLALRLRTLYLPGRDVDPLPVTPYDPARLERFVAFADANPFRIPPPPPPPPAPEPVVAQVKPEEVPPPAPPAPPKFPWRDWKLTGVAEGRGGPEAWLRNVKSGATMTLGLGDAIDVATLKGIVVGESAEFAIAEDVFRVLVGERMHRRRRGA